MAKDTPNNEVVGVDACLHDTDFRAALKKAYQKKDTADIENLLDNVYKIYFDNPDDRKQALQLIRDIDWTKLNDLERTLGRVDMG